MFAQDSLISLRLNRKRTQPTFTVNKTFSSTNLIKPGASSSPNKRSSNGHLPLDDLKARVAKRQRTGSISRKSLRFNMKENKVYHRHLSSEDLGNAWMSEKESEQVKTNVYRTVLSFRNRILNHQTDCIRGLEVHANPNLMRKKVESGKTFVALIIRQQTFLRGVMGNKNGNEQVLGRMSKMLSEDDNKQAHQEASLDEEEAALIYAEEAMKQRRLTVDVLNMALETHMGVMQDAKAQA